MMRRLNPFSELTIYFSESGLPIGLSGQWHDSGSLSRRLWPLKRAFANDANIGSDYTVLRVKSNPFLLADIQNL